MMAKPLIVAQQQRRTAGLRHHYIQIAITIDIRKCGPATYDRLDQIRAALVCGHSFEAHAVLVAAIPEKLGRLTILLQRIHSVDFRLQMAIRREHIQSTIEVVIEKKQTE